MFIITLKNGMAIAKTSSYSITDAGQVLNEDGNVIYGFSVKVFEIQNEDLPTDFAPYKYFYNEEEGFKLDESYVDPSAETLESKLLAAEARIAELEDALCELSTVVEEVVV